MKFPERRPRRPIVCRQAVELVTGYLEGTQAPADRRLRAHLGGCPHCAEYLAQMRDDDRADPISRARRPDPAAAGRVHRDLPALARRSGRLAGEDCNGLLVAVQYAAT